MTRETENVLLLLVGLCTAMIAITGTYTHYVKPSLLPWLVAAAVLLIALTLCAITRDIRRGPIRDDHAQDDHHDGVGHGHRPVVAWLLVLPIALLAFVVPPALGARAAEPTVTEVSRQVLYRPFPPLPVGRA